MHALVSDLLTLVQQNHRRIEREPVVLRDAAETCWQNVETGLAALRIDSSQTIQADRLRLA